MLRISRKAESFTESVIREMNRLAVAAGAVSLAQGFPDFPAPAEPAITEGFGGAAADLAAAAEREARARAAGQPRRTFRPGSRTQRSVPGKRRR